ncbi:hypothetical protein ACFQU2_16205 [Siccirubricoccus deserti]
MGDQHQYGPRSIPRVRDRYPLWSEPGLAKEVEAGGHYLPFTATGRRETLITSPAEAEPQYVAVLPGVGWGHVVAAIGTAGFFLSLTGEFLIEAALFFALALGGILAWLWQGSDPGPLPPREADIGGGIVVPTYATGAVSTASWAMVCLMLVQGTAYACLLGSYLFLWLVNGDAMWPPPGQGLPVAGFGLAALGFYAAGAASLQAAARLLAGRSPWPHRLALALAALLLLAGTAADGWALWQGGVRPSLHAYGAASWALFAWQGMHAAIALLMAGYTLARSSPGCWMRSGGRRWTSPGCSGFTPPARARSASPCCTSSHGCWHERRARHQPRLRGAAQRGRPGTLGGALRRDLRRQRLRLRARPGGHAAVRPALGAGGGRPRDARRPAAARPHPVVGNVAT